MPGFFASSTKAPTRPTNDLVPACGACGLHKKCSSPKMPVTGDGGRGILVVAEAPGKNEDEQGVQLVGKAGQHFRKVLSKLGYDLDDDCWKTNALICRPMTASGTNRKPSNQEVEYCRPNLLQTIKELKPRVVVPMGGPAIESVVGYCWGKSNVGSVGRWVGFQVPAQRVNAWVCPTYHPSFVAREDDEVVNLWFERHLESAFDIVGRPWETVPTWEQDVRVVMNDEKAAGVLRKMMTKPDGAVAFDYETTTLKPDTPWSEVVCCAVSWGLTEPKMTMSFPWRGEARRAMGELLRSPIPKIAANMKFEDRWTRKEFGHRPRNVVHDTMLMAHVMDNRPGICGLKFQSFVHLGQPEYDSHVSPYLEAPNARMKNKVKLVDKGQLFKYNGLDALLAFRLAVRQLQQMGFDLPWRV